MSNDSAKFMRRFDIVIGYVKFQQSVVLVEKVIDFIEVGFNAHIDKVEALELFNLLEPLDQFNHLIFWNRTVVKFNCLEILVFIMKLGN